MTQVTISPKYQVVIPREIREKLTLHKGQKVTVMTKGDLIVLVPDLPLKHYRGFLKGMSTEGIREKKERI